MVVPGTTFTKKIFYGCGLCKMEGMLLQPLSWHCIECVIQYERDVHEE